MRLRLYNTLSKNKELFKPIDSNSIKIYACGPTLYDNPHIGNFRPIIVFDILFRILRSTYGEKNILYARNITDIDDKIINKANEIGISTEELVKNTEVVYKKNLNSLSILQES